MPGLAVLLAEWATDVASIGAEAGFRSSALISSISAIGVTPAIGSFENSPIRFGKARREIIYRLAPSGITFQSLKMVELALYPPKPTLISCSSKVGGSLHSGALFGKFLLDFFLHRRYDAFEILVVIEHRPNVRHDVNLNAFLVNFQTLFAFESQFNIFFTSTRN